MSATRDKVIRELHEKWCGVAHDWDECALYDAFDAGAAAEREAIARWLEQECVPRESCNCALVRYQIRARGEGEK